MKTARISIPSSLDVAKRVLQVTNVIVGHVNMSNLKLQCALYVVQREFLSNHEMAFSEDFNAWDYIPCQPDVYYEFCGSGGMKISCGWENAIQLPLKWEETVFKTALSFAGIGTREARDIVTTPNGAYQRTKARFGKGSRSLGFPVIEKDLIVVEGQMISKQDDSEIEMMQVTGR